MKKVTAIFSLLMMICGLANAAVEVTLDFGDDDTLAGYEVAYSLNFSNAYIDRYWDLLANTDSLEMFIYFNEKIVGEISFRARGYGGDSYDFHIKYTDETIVDNRVTVGNVYTYILDADKTVEYLSWEDIGGAYASWVVVDDVKFNLVPEPASIIFALAGLGLAIKRKFLK